MKKTTVWRTRSFSALTLASLSLAAALAGSMPASPAELGEEQYRPAAIHFTPEKNWMKDPNGMVFHKGVYHMYYHHNLWYQLGNLSWGHATSKDLVHREEQPLAISTDAQDDIFSGSVVVDKNNRFTLHCYSREDVRACRNSGTLKGLNPV